MNQEYSLFKRVIKGKNTVWYFYYYENGKRKFRSTGKTKKYEAEQVAIAYVNKSQTDVKTTLFDYTKTFFIWGKCQWITRQHAKGLPFSEAVAKARRSHLENYILPKFGNRQINSLNRVEIENWLIGLKKKSTDKPLANQTKNHIMDSFRIVLREAEREKICNENCLKDAGGLVNNWKKRDVFTRQEIELLFPEDVETLISIWGSKKYAYFFYLLLATGIRVGEAEALQWKHVIWNEKRNGLLIEQAVKANRKVGTTKNGHSRLIVLSKRADDYLEDWLKETPFDNLQDYIFFGIDRDKPLTPTPLENRFKETLNKMKIDRTDRSLVIHSFRHTFNTIMRPRLPLEILQEMTGHRSEAMTEHYDHPDLSKEYDRLVNYSTFLDDSI